MMSYKRNIDDAPIAVFAFLFMLFLFSSSSSYFFTFLSAVFACVLFSITFPLEANNKGNI